MKVFCSGGRLLSRGYAEQMLFSEINAADTRTAAAAPSLTPTWLWGGFPRDSGDSGSDVPTRNILGGPGDASTALAPSLLLNLGDYLWLITIISVGQVVMRTRETASGEYFS